MPAVINLFRLLDKHPELLKDLVGSHVRQPRRTALSQKPSKPVQQKAKPTSPARRRAAS
jgi:hypothetical protein